MENSYSVKAKSLISKAPDRFWEGWFSTWITSLEQHFKKIINRENLCCPRCRLIIGSDFCIGVRVPQKVAGHFVFFAAHPSCMEGVIFQEDSPAAGQEFIVPAAVFLDLEKEILLAKAPFDKGVTSITIKITNGQWRVFVGYNNSH